MKWTQNTVMTQSNDLAYRNPRSVWTEEAAEFRKNHIRAATVWQSREAFGVGCTGQALFRGNKVKMLETGDKGTG